MAPCSLDSCLALECDFCATPTSLNNRGSFATQNVRRRAKPRRKLRKNQRQSKPFATGRLQYSASFIPLTFTVLQENTASRLLTRGVLSHENRFSPKPDKTPPGCGPC
jgi:hypothetical protein